MSVHSSQKYKKRDWTRIKFSGVGSHRHFLERIRKTLYYGNLPSTERLSLPVTELAAELYSEVKTRQSVQRLRLEEASKINRNACISPCTLVLAIIYLEQLKSSNYCYVDKISPSDLFIVSLMIATKFLNDSGEEDDILNSEWASSVGLSLPEVNRLEREFLAAINWEVFVEKTNFWKRLRLLEREIALKEGIKRGWFSYTDLENLLDTINGVALAQAVITSIFVNMVELARIALWPHDLQGTCKKASY
uniref:Protein CNPPD1 n=1 Tax=Rhodnius prolixus TaxID=13249 RepID=T1IFL6_RHOPR